MSINDQVHFLLVYPYNHKLQVTAKALLHIIMRYSLEFKAHRIRF